MRCEDRFYEIYGRDYDGIAFCPYRICPIGAHSDHNLGKITGLAIDKGIHIAYSIKHNGSRIRTFSMSNNSSLCP